VSLAILALLLLGLAGALWQSSLEDTDSVPSDSEPIPMVVERPAPTLLAVSHEREAEPPPAPANPTAPIEPTLSVLVLSEGEPVVDASLSIEFHSEDDLAVLVPSYSTDAEGRCVLDALGFILPLALVVRGSANMIPVAVTLDALPEDEVVVSLRVGQPLEIHTIDMDRRALPHIDVVVFPVGLWARGNNGMTRARSRWFLEDSRRIRTDEDGVAVVKGLDPARLYRACAPGHGTPMQIVPPPKVPQPKHDPVAPGSGRTLTLMLAPLRIVWGRAVDATTGSPVAMASFRRFFAPDRTPKEQVGLRQALPLWLARDGLLALPDTIRTDDYFRTFVIREEGGSTVPTGPFKVNAPGYQEQEIILQARTQGEASRGPTVIELERTAGASFTPVRIALHTKRRRVRALMQLRRGKKTLYRRGFDSEFHKEDFELEVVEGQYELFVGGTSVGLIEAKGRGPIVKTVELDTLPSVQITFDVDGAPYSGIGSVALSPGPGASAHWMFIHSRIPFEGGRSPHVVVPAGDLVVGSGTGDGRYAEYERPSIAPGEKAIVALRVP
jgi:hypothetical protein